MAPLAGWTRRRTSGGLTTEVFLSWDRTRVNAKSLVTRRVHLRITRTPHTRTSTSPGGTTTVWRAVEPGLSSALGHGPEVALKADRAIAVASPADRDGSRACVVCRRAKRSFASLSLPTRWPGGARQRVLVTGSQAHGIGENGDEYGTVQARGPVGSRNSS